MRMELQTVKDGDRVEKSFSLKTVLVSEDGVRAQYLLESQEATESTSSSSTGAASASGLSSVTARNWRELERLEREVLRGLNFLPSLER